VPIPSSILDAVGTSSTASGPGPSYVKRGTARPDRHVAPIVPIASSADLVEHLRQESRVIGPRLRRDLAPLVPSLRSRTGLRGEGVLGETRSPRRPECADCIEHLRQESRVVGPRLCRDILDPDSSRSRDIGAPRDDISAGGVAPRPPGARLKCRSNRAPSMKSGPRTTGGQ